MQRVYANRINWENEPSQNTPINENNLNKMDYALFTIDGRVCDQELTKANQSDLLLSVKRVDYDTTTGVFTFEWQNGTIKTIDLNIEKIPVSFSLDADGVIRMKTADGTVFTADISQTLKQYNFVDSSVIDFTESVDTSGNKTITANIIDGSITAEKLQPNFLADCTSAKNMAETKALVSEGYAVGEQNGVPVDASSPYYHNNAKYYSDKSASTIYQQSDWNETDSTQSAYIINKPFNSLDQNDFEVKNGVLKAKAQAIDSLNNIADVDITNAINGEVLTYENNKWINKKSSGGLLPRLVITTEAGATVTAEKDGTILSVTNNEIDIPEFGTWVVKSFINGEYAIVNVVVDSVKIYNVNAMHFSATINVTAPNGSIITISNETETYTKESAPYSFDVRKSGTWSVECQLEDAIKVASVTIEHNGDVKTASFSFAKIIVNYEAEFSGKVITATDGTRTYTRTANGVVSFAIANYGTWTISAVVDGETYETEVSINSDTEYTVELIYKKGFEYTEWLRLAGISQSYASLDDVLADEKAIRTLMTKHASVDYLAGFDEAIEEVEKIINNDICAKWINLRDYALDTLYANPVLKAEMDTADKYFYGEWVEIDGVWQPKGNVPVMTSNTAPYGEAIQISNYGDNYAWKAFNENNSNFWESGGMSGDNRAWLGYKFVNPICVKMVTMSSGSTDVQYFPKRYKVQGSNDGSAWEDISSELTNANNTPNVKHTNTFINDKYFTYIRVVDIETFGSHQYLQMNYLQFFGRELKSGEVDYSEHEERHYIYDHGIEIVDVESNSDDAITKNSSSFRINNIPNSYQRAFANASVENYDNIRVKVFNVSDLANNPPRICVENSAFTESAFRSFTKEELPNNEYLDVSNISDSTLRPTIKTYGGVTFAEVTEWWLE